MIQNKLKNKLKNIIMTFESDLIIMMIFLLLIFFCIGSILYLTNCFIKEERPEEENPILNF